MSLLEMVAILLAGLAAGTINTVVGSGTLVTFPTLLAFGVPPVVANVSNTIGLFPGSVSGAVGYRRELHGQRARLVRLGAASLIGGVVGAVLLLVLPPEAFRAIVPVLIGIGVLLVAFQPWVRAWVDRVGSTPKEGTNGAWWVWILVLLTGVYGGYFGAAQGVLLMAILGIGLNESIQRNNATKNVLAGLVNGVAALLFAVVAEVDWAIVGLLAVGAVIGGQVGAGVGRRLPPALLRSVIIVVGCVALVSFLLN